MSYRTALAILHSEISHLQEDLKRYVCRENARPSWIDRQNELIANLVNVYNHLELLELSDFWHKVETQMKATERVDPMLSQHTIIVRIKPDGYHSSWIQFNAFDQ